MSSPPADTRVNRWAQLALMVACTVMLSNMQYGWTLFVNPMQQENHWDRTSIQLAFSILIMLNTWLAPLEGIFVDRYGPRPVVTLGGLCAAAAWVINSYAQSLGWLYAGAVVGGIAMGCVFGTCIGTALKWFPDRRGLATGLIAMGYGLGAAASVIPLAGMIQSSGYRRAFLVFGLIQGLSLFAMGLFLLKPVVRTPGTTTGARAAQVDIDPTKTLRTAVFWTIYLVYLMIGFGGMVMTAQLGPLALDLGVAKQVVAILGISIPVLTLAASLDNIANGITRPLCGFLSDRIGRENTMLLVFTAEGVSFAGMIVFGRHPLAFVLFAALIFLFWGEIFTIFPAICGDTFGARHAAANNGLLYTAKGVSSLAVPVANLLVAATGTWTSVLLAACLSSVAAGFAAKFVVAPMRRRLLAKYSLQAPNRSCTTFDRIEPHPPLLT
jgi:OFA family oxalate/formate antiporter-like MFS transporter